MRSEIFLGFLFLLCVVLFAVDVLLISTVKKLNTGMRTVVVDSENSEVSVKTGGEIYRIPKESTKAFTLFKNESLRITNDGDLYLLRFLDNVYEVSIEEVEVKLEKWDK